MHKKVNNRPQNNIDIIREESPNQHRPKDIASRKTGKYKEKSAFGSAGVAGCGDKINSRHYGDRSGERYPKINTATKSREDKKRDQNDDKVKTELKQDGF